MATLNFLNQFPQSGGMAGIGGERRLALRSIRVVEFPDLDGAFIEIVKQACIDAHPAEVLSKGLPVGSAAADWAVVNADHSIAPDIGGRLTRNAHLVRRKISHAPGEPPTQRAVTVRNPCGPARQFYPHLAAVAASVNAHGRLYSPVWNIGKRGDGGSTAVPFPSLEHRAEKWEPVFRNNDVIAKD